MTAESVSPGQPAHACGQSGCGRDVHLSPWYTFRPVRRSLRVVVVASHRGTVIDTAQAVGHGLLIRVFVNPNNAPVQSSDDSMNQDPFNVPAAAMRSSRRQSRRHEKPHRRYEALRKDQQSYFLMGLWLSLQGLFLLLSLNWALIALGLVSLLGSMYCFFLVWDVRKRKRTMLHGPEDEPSPSDHAEVPSVRARVEGNGIRFVILLGAITLVLLAVGLLQH